MNRLLALLSILVVQFAAVQAHAVHQPATGEVYWNKVLPNTPIPTAIKELITPSVTVSERGVSVQTIKPQLGDNIHWHLPPQGLGGDNIHWHQPPQGLGDNIHWHQPPQGLGDNIHWHLPPQGLGGDNIHWHQPPQGLGDNIHWHLPPQGLGGDNIHWHQPPQGLGGDNIHWHLPPQGLGGDNIHWHQPPDEAQVSAYKDASFYFFEKDLQPGNKLTWQFRRTTPSGETLFISHEDANSVPFTSAKFPDILTHFSIQPNSVIAKIMYHTLKECERPAAGKDGERMHCATSLESMVEFSMATIGTRNIQAMSTDVYVDKKENGDSAKQQYTITSSSSSSSRILVGLAKRLKFKGHANNVVVCHAQSYAYPVFYCHLIRETKAYQVSMVGEDGTKVETVAVCHMDTAKFDPKHIAFKLLHVKPGTVPICHFLSQDSLVWEPKN